MGAVPRWEKQLRLTGRGVPEFFRSPDELSAMSTPLAVAHDLGRVWAVMQLDGVLCLDGTPVAYFKELGSHDRDHLVKLHQALWNHGLAPLLVAVTPVDVRVYSALAFPTDQPDALDDDQRLVVALDRVAQTMELTQLVRTIELGDFFHTHSKAFDLGRRVDAYLLDNLEAARERLLTVADGRLSLQQVHALLCRIVFTCYLVDRHVITPAYFDAEGAPGASDVHTMIGSARLSCAALLLDESNALQSVERLYSLFRTLRQDFNGDVFGNDLKAEQACVTEEHLDIIRKFLRGDSLRSGQMSLGFWVYDFRVIPIETISAIYEQSLEAEGRDAIGVEARGSYRRRKGAYYTPRYLAEVVVAQALEGWQGALLGRRYFDPSCGSGIFLVVLFNRLADAWVRQHPKASNQERAQGFADILTTSLFGLDDSKAACGVAALSLYLAMLDRLSPRDIQQLQCNGALLPRLVFDPNNLEESGHSLVQSNFFSEKCPLTLTDMDLVIGNPPWVSVEGNDPMVAWCRKHKKPVAQNQLAYGFLWKATEHVADKGRVTLVLPASLLFNAQEKAVEVVREWLTSVTVETVLNLADFRQFLFRDAIHPALVARYRKQPPDLTAHTICYVVPKASPESLFAEVLTISPEDRVQVPLRQAIPRRKVIYRRGRLVEAPVPSPVWKERLWGTGRDLRFLDRLRDYPPLMASGDTAERWILREGFNRHGKGRSLEREALLELPFLKKPCRYIIPDHVLKKKAPSTIVNYCPPEEVFYAPHVLFPHGVPEDGGRISVGYCSHSCTFTHSVRVLKGPPEDEDLLRFITCMLASPLALYVLFHSTGSLGIGRPKVHLTEYAALPFPRPDTDKRCALVRTVADRHRSLEDKVEDTVLESDLTEAFAPQLDELVYRYYDVDDWEQALIEDTVKVVIPSVTPRRSTIRNAAVSIPIMQPSHTADRLVYAKFLSEALNEWAADGPWRFSCDIITAASADLGVAKLSRFSTTDAAKNTFCERECSTELEESLERIRRTALVEGGSIRRLRHLKVFDGQYLYIVKPLKRRYWTRTAALNDADELANAILGARVE